MTGFKIMQI